MQKPCHVKRSGEESAAILTAKSKHFHPYNRKAGDFSPAFADTLKRYGVILKIVPQPFGELHDRFPPSTVLL